MTTPPEVLSRIREEARKEAHEVWLSGPDVPKYTEPLAWIKGYALCYERLKLDEWERERWIPVEERLPDGESYEYVSICTAWGDIDIAKRDWHQGPNPDHWRTRAGRRIENEDITHWKPLPQPPNTNPLDR